MLINSFQVNSFYLPNVLGNGMTRDENLAWRQWMRDMEYLVTDPNEMREIERSRQRIAERVAKRLSALRQRLKE